MAHAGERKAAMLHTLRVGDVVASLAVSFTAESVARVRQTKSKSVPRRRPDTRQGAVTGNNTQRETFARERVRARWSRREAQQTLTSLGASPRVASSAGAANGCLAHR